MNTRQLQYAIALAKVRNFSKVADMLNISQPALSKQIINLEGELGLKIFNRGTTPLTLTAAGEHFIREAEDLCYREEQLLRAMSRYQSGEYGRLVIGVTPFRSLYLMPELVKKIRSRYPGIRISLHEVNSAQLRKDAAEGKCDLAIVNLPVDTALLDVIPLEPDILVLAVHNTMAGKLPVAKDGKRLTVDFSQLQDYPFVVLSPGQELRNLFDGLCTAAGFRPIIAAEVVGVTSALAMVQAGVGAAVLPLQFIHSQNFDNNLSLYVVKNSLYSRQPAVVTRRGQVRTPYADFAISLLTEQE